MPYTFFPDAPGGTEVYVAELIAAMRGHGVTGMVAAPGPVDEEYEHNGIAVYRFARDAQERLAYAYGEPDESAAGAFRQIVQKLRPDIVHMHAHTAAVSERLADVAHESGARIVFTYHSPTVSCLRGTMMFEEAPCDGVLNVTRCTVCTLQKNGVPPALGNVVAMLPSEIGKTTAGLGVKGAIATALRMKDNAAAAHLRFASLMQKADDVVAVCQWVKDVLIRNGVPEAKVTLCRQGFSGPANASGQNQRDHAGGLRIAYFGRIDPIKGVDVLIEAMKGIPDANVVLDIYGIVQPGSDAYAASLKDAGDSRVRFHAPLPPEAVGNVMAQYDFVAVPSLWLETGPLVVYEAFASGTPVLGSDLGGIAELVTDGVDGILLRPGDADEWARAIAACAADLSRVENLKAGIRPPRTMRDVAMDMTALYAKLLQPAT